MQFPEAYARKLFVLFSSTCHWIKGLLSHDVQVKWVKDAKSSAYAIVQETVKGVTKGQITGMPFQILCIALLGIGMQTSTVIHNA